MPKHTMPRAAIFSGLLLAAIGLMSCTVVADMASADRAVETVDPKPGKIARQSRVYAYPAAADGLMISKKTQPVIYHGSAPYICSPSGFGQKSRCFARS